MSLATVQKTFTVPTKLGLHARPAALFVQAVQRFRCEVAVSKGDLEVNGKSLMGLMMLAAENGARIKVTLTGSEAPQAMVEVEKLFARNFDEA